MNNIIRTLCCIAGSIVVVSLLSCGPGNSSVVYDFPPATKVAGHITDMNGDPASDATVSIRPYNYLPQPCRLGKQTGSTVVGDVFSTTTDSRGRFSFDSTEIRSLFFETARENGRDIDQFVINAISKKGDAFLLTRKIIVDRDFIESSTWININSPDVGTILKPASTIKGAAATQTGDYLEGFVLVYGLNTYAPIEPDGSFQLDNLPEGSLQLLFLFVQSDTGYAEVITTSGTTIIIDTSAIIELNPKQVRAKGMGTVSAPDEIVSEKPAVISAIPDKGYEFRYWNVTNGSATFTDSTEASTTVTLESADAVIEAVFGIVTFKKTFLGADITLRDFSIDYLNNKYHSTTVLETGDGGYVLNGVSPAGVCLIKTDAKGDSLCGNAFDIFGSRSMEGPSAHLVQQTNDGGYFLAGYNWNFAGPYNYMFKTGTQGDSLYKLEALFGGGIQGMQLTGDGSFVIVGNTFGARYGGAYSENVFIKISANGDPLWEKTFTDTSDSNRTFLHAVEQVNDGGYIIAGSDRSFTIGNVEKKAFLMRTTSEGDTIWKKLYGADNGITEAFSVRQTGDGGFIIAGYTTSYGAGGRDVYVIRTDNNDNVIWEKTCGGINHDEASSIELTSDGGYIIAGITASFGAGERDAYLIRMDSGGDTTWTKTFGGSGIDEAYSARQTSDGGYILTGYTAVGENDVKTFLIKTDEYGNVY